MNGGEVFAEVKRYPDLEVHVKLYDELEDGSVLVTIRDYIPSIRRYGRGVTFEAALIPDIIEGLDAAFTATLGPKPKKRKE